MYRVFYIFDSTGKTCVLTVFVYIKDTLVDNDSREYYSTKTSSLKVQYAGYSPDLFQHWTAKRIDKI